MAKTNIFSTVTIGTWQQVQSVTYNNCHFVALKGAFNASDTIDVKKVKYIELEIGTDVGGTDAYGTIQFVSLNFNEICSSNKELDAKLAMARVGTIPKGDYYIRVSRIVTDDDKQYTTGTTSIAIGVIPIL